jgi:excisionase family DNA binding protein
MARNYFTTNDIARMCNVTRQTAINWIKSRKLKANFTPGGHRRVLEEDLIAFFKENRMDPAIIETYENEHRKTVPPCWEYFSMGFTSRSSRHDCERCLIKEARAQRCFAIARALPPEEMACQPDCGQCSYFRRYGDAPGGRLPR